ncbi:MAG TPA: hypothetical protein V6C52_08785 [Coleofasciculaceae cyanobacterium]|jgi:hypothetical protein
MNPTSLNPSPHPALTFGQKNTLRAGLVSLALLGAGAGLGYVANNQPSKPVACDQPGVSIDADGTAVTSFSCEPDRVEFNGDKCKKLSPQFPDSVKDDKGKPLRMDLFICRTKPDTTILKGFRSLHEEKPQ